MAITALHEDSATIGSTEYSLPNDGTTLTPQTTDGVFQVFIDFDAMDAGDRYEVLVYEKVQSSGAQRVVYRSVLEGSQSGPFVTPSLVLMHGWDVTVAKLAGTDRSIGWSIRQVA